MTVLRCVSLSMFAVLHAAYSRTIHLPEARGLPAPQSPGALCNALDRPAHPSRRARLHGVEDARDVVDQLGCAAQHVALARHQHEGPAQVVPAHTARLLHDDGACGHIPRSAEAILEVSVEPAWGWGFGFGFGLG